MIEIQSEIIEISTNLENTPSYLNKKDVCESKLERNQVSRGIHFYSYRGINCIHLIKSLFLNLSLCKQSRVKLFLDYLVVQKA